jgi:epoxyqueuosine reductase QueG
LSSEKASSFCHPGQKHAGISDIRIPAKNSRNDKEEAYRNDKEEEAYRNDNRRENDSIHGRVARYAWGKDYHEVIKEKHHKLIEILRGEFPR